MMADEPTTAPNVQYVVIHDIPKKILLPWAIVFLMGFMMVAGAIVLTFTGDDAPASSQVVCKVVNR